MPISLTKRKWMVAQLAYRSQGCKILRLTPIFAIGGTGRALSIWRNLAGSVLGGDGRLSGDEGEMRVAGNLIANTDLSYH